jgi:hypothetical protein
MEDLIIWLVKITLAAVTVLRQWVTVADAPIAPVGSTVRVVGVSSLRMPRLHCARAAAIRAAGHDATARIVTAGISITQ